MWLFWWMWMFGRLFAPLVGVLKYMLSLIDAFFLFPSSILASFFLNPFDYEKVRVFYVVTSLGLEPNKSWMPIDDISICFS